MVDFLDGRWLFDTDRDDYDALGLLRRPLHRIEQRRRHLQVHPVAAGFPVRPQGEPVLALGIVHRRLQEDAQQGKLEDRRRALQPPVRILGVDDRPVIDRLAPVRRAEHLVADRDSANSGPRRRCGRSAPRATTAG